MKLDKNESAFNLKKFMSDPLYKQGDPEMNRQFEKVFVHWWTATLRAAKGARLKRLKFGLTLASMYFLSFTWFPAFGSLKGLIPEFEVKEYKDGFRYIDFAFLTNAYRMAIELDGRASHRLNATPSEYEDELMRQNHLVIDGWSVIRLAFLSIRDKPRQCQQVLQQMLGKSGVVDGERLELTITERRMLEYAARSSEPLEPFELRSVLGLHRNTISKYVASLVSKGLIVPMCEDHKHKYRYLLSTKVE